MSVKLSSSWNSGMAARLSQFNKSNNALLVADARGAARAWGKPFWATCQAEGAHVSPEGDQHLRMWWRSLHLAYVAGADQVADEECLYREYHQRSYGRNETSTRKRRFWSAAGSAKGRRTCGVRTNIPDRGLEVLTHETWRMMVSTNLAGVARDGMGQRPRRMRWRR